MNNLRPGVVSIGVPTFNRPVLLRRCLQGLTAQTYPHIDILVSDNGSTDPGVQQVIDEFVVRDARVRYFRHASNQGPTANFQYVLDQADGEFFMWAADDDHREPDFVRALVAELNGRPECAVAFSDFSEVDARQEPLPGYPDHLRLLEPFAAGQMSRRLLAYFFQLEPKGKANPIYGLIRREKLRGFTWDWFVGAYAVYGVDMLFVFYLLTMGPLGLARQKLYQCGVAAPVAAQAAAARSPAQKVAAQLRNLGVQLHYSLQYIKIARGFPRVLLAILWPLKALDIVIRLFVFVEARNMAARIRRWSAR